MLRRRADMNSSLTDVRDVQGRCWELGPWLTSAMLAVTLYVLSLGPAYRLTVAYPERFENAYCTVYAPILSVCGHSYYCLVVVSWYGDLWLPTPTNER